MILNPVKIIVFAGVSSANISMRLAFAVLMALIKCYLVINV